jgi:uncharacterized DUF497 family protein
MKFEFDSNKSKLNKEKHGIDFIEGQELWEDPDYIEIPAKIVDEQRSLIIGKIRNKHYSAIITYRKENIRIISIRRSQHKEVEIYEG